MGLAHAAEDGGGKGWVSAALDLVCSVCDHYCAAVLQTHAFALLLWLGITGDVRVSVYRKTFFFQHVGHMAMRVCPGGRAAGGAAAPNCQHAGSNACPCVVHACLCEGQQGWAALASWLAGWLIGQVICIQSRRAMLSCLYLHGHATHSSFVGGLLLLHCRPGFFFNAFSNDAYLQGLADCVDQVNHSIAHYANSSAVLTRQQDSLKQQKRRVPIEHQLMPVGTCGSTGSVIVGGQRAGYSAEL